MPIDALPAPPIRFAHSEQIKWLVKKAMSASTFAPSGDIFARVGKHPCGGGLAMSYLELIFTVCLIANAGICKDNHIAVDQRLTIYACTIQAQLIMAQWVGDNPGWRVKRWHCDYTNKREERV